VFYRHFLTKFPSGKVFLSLAKMPATQ
jgi:hypothetical protein